MTLTAESVEEKTVQEEPRLFKTPDKKQRSFPFGILVWAVLVIGAVHFFSPSGEISGIGTLKAKNFAQIEAPSASTLIEVIHKKGEMVQKGDVLAKFSNPELAQKLLEWRKKFEIFEEESKTIERDLSFSKIKLDQAGILVENGVIGKTTFGNAEHEYNNLQQKLSQESKEKELLQKEVDYLEQTVSKLELRAPFAGVLLSDPWQRTGGLFKPGDVVYEIGDPGSFYVEFPVVESQVQRIQVGDRARIRFEAVPERLFDGQVTAIGVRTNKEVEKVFKIKHVVICEIQVDQIPASFRYGMQAQINIKHGGMPKILRKNIFSKGGTQNDKPFEF